MQDYGMRIYDATLGRFLSVDPISNKYPMLTPYQFASNKPITSIDLDGLEEFNVTMFKSPDGNWVSDVRCDNTSGPLIVNYTTRTFKDPSKATINPDKNEYTDVKNETRKGDDYLYRQMAFKSMNQMDNATKAFNYKLDPNSKKDGEANREGKEFDPTKSNVGITGPIAYNIAKGAGALTAVELSKVVQYVKEFTSEMDVKNIVIYSPNKKDRDLIKRTLKDAGVDVAKGITFTKHKSKVYNTGDNKDRVIVAGTHFIDSKDKPKEAVKEDK